MITRAISANVELTPKELAHEFANMDDSKQAEFFNDLARVVDKWEKPFAFQLQSISDNPILTMEGRNMMAQIGQYGLDL